MQAPAARGRRGVDVHAVKSFDSAACTQAPKQTQQQTQQTQQTSCPSTTITATEVVGVWHHTGSKTNPFVLIHPSANSAHFSKHAEDKVATVQTTKTVASGESCSSSQQQSSQQTSQSSQATQNAQSVQAAQAQQTVAPAAAATPAAAGGVLGAQATLTRPKAKPAGGVLGAAGRVAGTRLPFTGLQLWIALLVAAALVGGGVVVRRAARGTS